MSTLRSDTCSAGVWARACVERTLVEATYGHGSCSALESRSASQQRCYSNELTALTANELMIQLTNYAAAANVREAVDGLASAALIEADVDALAAFLVIMIFLSASPPIFTPSPLDGDASDEVEGVAKVAAGGRWEEESEGRDGCNS